MEVAMNTPRRKYSKEFREEAVKMVVEGGLSKAEVGRRLGVHQTQIGNWVQAFRADGAAAFPGNGKLKPQDAEVRRLEKENRELRQENEFLKKTASFFASQKK